MSQSISQRAAAGAMAQMPKAPEKHCPTCGQLKPSPRNEKRHKMFMAMLPQALDHWPDTYKEFQPISTTHLRKWLTYKAGWVTTKDLEIGGPSKAMAVAAVRFFLANEDQNKFYTVTAKGIREYTPKSIAFNKCPEASFRHIMDSSVSLIESITGVPIERLKREVAA